MQEQLIWPTFSASQFFRDYAKRHSLSLESAEEQNDRLTKKVDLRMQQMLQGKGNLIVEGWMAGIMGENNPEVLRVLLTCDDEVRIKRFAAREKVSLTEAMENVKAREKNLFSVLESIYHRNDFTEPKNYNFVVDTTSLTPQALVQKVLDKLDIKPNN